MKPGDFNLEEAINTLKVASGEDALIEFLDQPTTSVKQDDEHNEFETPGSDDAPGLTVDLKESPDPAENEFAEVKSEAPVGSGKFKWSNKSGALTEIIDQLQEPLNDWLYTISVFTPQERADLKRIIRNQKDKRAGITDVPTAYEDALIDKASEMEEYQKELPFSPDEKKDLKEAFAELLKDADSQMGPGTAFSMTLLFIFLPRWLPILPAAIGKALQKFGLKDSQPEVKREVSWSEQSAA